MSRSVECLHSKIHSSSTVIIKAADKEENGVCVSIRFCSCIKRFACFSNKVSCPDSSAGRETSPVSPRPVETPTA